jgi:hypothetical protein
MTDNTMAKRKKDRQHKGIKKTRQTTQWHKENKTDKTKA